MKPTTETVTSNTVIEEKRVKGVCKWFNNKSGYGFLTITEGEKKDSDIFVYHNSLQVGNENQYKYLVQGEYVDFTVSNVEENKRDAKYEFHATNVTGINGGKLMCETRNESRSLRPKSELNSNTLFSSRRPNKRIFKNEKIPLENSFEEKIVSQPEEVLVKDDLSKVKPKDLESIVKSRGRPSKKNK
jgi:cold shock CspA family protein